jgi:hypothetical protein
MFLDSRVTARENAAAGGLASREWLAARGNRLNNTPTEGFAMESTQTSSYLGCDIHTRAHAQVSLQNIL